MSNVVALAANENRDPLQQRGIRNNNPGNIDRDLTQPPWDGEIRDPDDPRLTPFQRNELVAGRFCVFASLYWGIRGMVRNLQAYQARLHLLSVRAMIERWAPPNENNTELYIGRVCAALGVRDDAPVDMRDYRTAYQMVVAITAVENYACPYSAAQIDGGLQLAGIIKPVTLANSNTAKGAALATAGGVGSGVLAVQQKLQDAADLVGPAAYGGSHTLLWIALGLSALCIAATIAGYAIVWYERKQRAARDTVIEAPPEIAEDPAPAGKALLQVAA